VWLWQDSLVGVVVAGQFVGVVVAGQFGVCGCGRTIWWVWLWQDSLWVWLQRGGLLVVLYSAAQVEVDGMKFELQKAMVKIKQEVETVYSELAGGWVWLVGGA
jgi:hypothetical protein